ncbi:hypothetical protein CDAR_550901 [Caerostris darwini]|uniref:Uncharacterized protein n=1 Tax=Caerostris darwini TaxID=1538125 RepID=A0AAV4QME3_9ARAC|nr:hypothetical protein CDAR_550901 [Caerostris darwini]
MPQDTIGIASHPLPCLVAICDVPPQMLEALGGCTLHADRCLFIGVMNRRHFPSKLEVGRHPRQNQPPRKISEAFAALLSHVKLYISKR